MDAAKRKVDVCKAEVKELRKQEKSALRKLGEIHKDIAGSFGVKQEDTADTEERMEVDGAAENPDEDLDDSAEKDDSEDEGNDDVEEVALQESIGVLSDAEKRKLSQEIALLESEIGDKRPDLRAIAEYQKKESECQKHVSELDSVTESRDEERKKCDKLRKKRLDEFMAGFSTITLKLKELYQMITLGGDAELELVDSLDPFSDGILFSVRPPKKSWKNISNLSGGEKTLSSLALVFALHHFKPTPLYFLDEIDAALDFKNVSIVANYVKERTKDAQFIIISLRNNMFELADRLVGIYKTHHSTKSVTVNPRAFVVAPPSKTVTQRSAT